MQYILLDNFNGEISAAHDDDSEIITFENLTDANEALPELCQNGQIVPLGVDIINLLFELNEFRLAVMNEEGAKNFNFNPGFIGTLEEVLKF